MCRYNLNYLSAAETDFLEATQYKFERELLFCFSLRHCYIGHFVHYVRMCATEFYEHGGTLQRVGYIFLLCKANGVY